MYFITTKRMLEVCFFQHTPTFIIEPIFNISLNLLAFSFPQCYNVQYRTKYLIFEKIRRFPL